MKQVLTERDLMHVVAGSRLHVPPDTILTPAARELAASKQIEICYQQPASTGRTVAVAADHGGFAMKQILKQLLIELGYIVYDFGTHDTQPVDYPDFAYKVAEAVSSRRCWRGIVIDGAGIGSCMAANKVPGVRAACCHDVYTARNSREHNDANVLTLGSNVVSPEAMREIVLVWLTTDVGAERHRRRVEKIMDIERKFFSQT